MELLITGGFGYIGGRLAQYLESNKDYNISLGSRQQVKSPQWLPGVSVAQTQWGSPVELEKICEGMDAVVHLAGMNAQSCADDPATALEFNGVTTARLLHSAIRKGVKRFVYLSTAHVYGSPLSGVITEETCPVSLHPYASSHRAGEDVVREAHSHGEIEGVVIRLSNSFGAPVHKRTNCWMLLVNDLCRQAVTTQRMVLHSSGLQRRDFITLTDACRAIAHFLELPAVKLDNGLFNVGGAWTPSILELAGVIRERASQKMGIEIEFSSLPAKEGENAPLLDYRIDKLKQTGFELCKQWQVEVDALLDFCMTEFQSDGHKPHKLS